MDVRVCVHGRRKQFSRSATNTLILSFGCRRRRCCCCHQCWWCCFCYWYILLVYFSYVRVILFRRIGSPAVSCRFDRFHRILLKNSFTGMSVCVCVRNMRRRSVSRVLNMKNGVVFFFFRRTFRCGWIYFSHILCERNSRCSAATSPSSSPSSSTVADVVRFFFYSSNKYRRWSKREVPKRRKNRRENLKWTWMMYLRGITRIIAFRWHRPIHSSNEMKSKGASKRKKIHTYIRFMLVFAMSVCIYHLVGCLPFRLFRLDIPLATSYVSYAFVCAYCLPMCLSTHTEYITRMHQHRHWHRPRIHSQKKKVKIVRQRRRRRHRWRCRRQRRCL